VVIVVFELKEVETLLISRGELLGLIEGVEDGGADGLAFRISTP